MDKISRAMHLLNEIQKAQGFRPDENPWTVPSVGQYAQIVVPKTNTVVSPYRDQNIDAKPARKKQQRLGTSYASDVAQAYDIRRDVIRKELEGDNSRPANGDTSRTPGRVPRRH